MPTVLFESITKVTIPSFGTFRVWTAETELKAFYQDTQQAVELLITEKYNEAKRMGTPLQVAFEVLNRVMGLEKTAAAEFTDTYGNGCVIYKDWP